MSLNLLPRGYDAWRLAAPGDGPEPFDQAEENALIDDAYELAREECDQDEGEKARRAR